MASTSTALKPPIKVLVTGANGKIAYNLIPHLLSGAAFGHDQPIILHLLNRCENNLQGLAMEIQDCVFPLHQGTLATSQVAQAFCDVDVAILLSSVSRGSATTRLDLLEANARIIHRHGQALEKYAKASVKILVVTNPCNTMAFVCRQAAPSIPDSCFTCLTQLDYNRALHQLTSRFPLMSEDQMRIGIFGNHSEKLVVDLSATPVSANLHTVNNSTQSLSPEDKREIQRLVRDRGYEIIVRSHSTSLMSVTAAIVTHLRAWWLGTGQDQWLSMGVVSDGSYQIPRGLVSSFPVTVSSDREIHIVKDFPLSEHTRLCLKDSILELESEVDLVKRSFSECGLHRQTAKFGNEQIRH